MEQELATRARERQISKLIEHHQVEPGELPRQGPALADPGLLFEACHQRYEFGQPVGGVIQTAFIVENLAMGIDRWIADLGVGPWFWLDSFKDSGATYRGTPSHADVSIAMAFAGNMLIELIQPKDEPPSVYRETQTARGFGFHHFGVSTVRFEKDLADYEARGHTVAFRAQVPTGVSRR